MTDWYTRCAYNPEAKQRFHTAARLRLRHLAEYLGFPPDALRFEIQRRRSRCQRRNHAAS